MDTVTVKKILTQALQKPSKKNMAILSEAVLELCDDRDREPTVFDVIDKNQKSMEKTFNTLANLMKGV